MKLLFHIEIRHKNKVKEIWKKLFEKDQIYLSSYKDVIIIAHLLAEQHHRFTAEGDIGAEKIKVEQLNSILAKNSGQTFKKIEADTDRDNFLTSKEAKAYGLIDSILAKRK